MRLLSDAPNDRSRLSEKAQASKRSHEFVIERIEPQDARLGIYADAAACQLDKIRRYPSDQVVRLHVPTRAIRISEGSDISDHPHPGIMRRDVIDIKKALRFCLCRSTGKIVIREIRQKPATTQIGERREIALSAK